MMMVRSCANIGEILSDKGSELLVDEKELSIMNKFASSVTSQSASSSSSDQITPRQDGQGH